MRCLPFGSKAANIAGMGIVRKWTSPTSSCERSLGLASSGNPSRSSSLSGASRLTWQLLQLHMNGRLPTLHDCVCFSEACVFTGDTMSANRVVAWTGRKREPRLGKKTSRRAVAVHAHIVKAQMATNFNAAAAAVVYCELMKRRRRLMVDQLMAVALAAQDTRRISVHNCQQQVLAQSVALGRLAPFATPARSGSGRIPGRRRRQNMSSWPQPRCASGPSTC